MRRSPGRLDLVSGTAKGRLFQVMFRVFRVLARRTGRRILFSSDFRRSSAGT